MRDLIKALTILLKYRDPSWPTHCEHDTLTITSEIDPKNVSIEDIEELYKLGFFIDEENNCFTSFKFGSC